MDTLWLNLKKKGISDHAPIYMEIYEAIEKKRAPFRFLNVLTEHQDFENVIKQSWDQQFTGTSMFKVWRKL